MRHIAATSQYWTGLHTIWHGNGWNPSLRYMGMVDAYVPQTNISVPFWYAFDYVYFCMKLSCIKHLLMGDIKMIIVGAYVRSYVCVCACVYACSRAFRSVSASTVRSVSRVALYFLNVIETSERRLNIKMLSYQCGDSLIKELYLTTVLSFFWKSRALIARFMGPTYMGPT